MKRPIGFRAAQQGQQPQGSDYRRVVVVFTRPERDLAKFDIARGPCVPLPGRKRALLGPVSQDPGTFRKYEDLFALVLPDVMDGPWADVQEVGRAALVTFSDAFTRELAKVSREVIRRGAERPKDVMWALEETDRLAARWLRLTSWPQGMELGGVRGQIVSVTGPARVAEDRDQRLYCWSGPGFNPYVLATGTAETLPAYLADKRRRHVTFTDAD